MNDEITRIIDYLTANIEHMPTYDVIRLGVAMRNEVNDRIENMILMPDEYREGIELLESVK